MYWVSEAEDGQADALNEGFGKATGEMQVYIDSDDFYLPGAFIATATHFNATPESDFYLRSDSNCRRTRRDTAHPLR